MARGRGPGPGPRGPGHRDSAAPAAAAATGSASVCRSVRARVSLLESRFVQGHELARIWTRVGMAGGRREETRGQRLAEVLSVVQQRPLCPISRPSGSFTPLAKCIDTVLFLLHMPARPLRQIVAQLTAAAGPAIAWVGIGQVLLLLSVPLRSCVARTRHYLLRCSPVPPMSSTLRYGSPLMS